MTLSKPRSRAGWLVVLLTGAGVFAASLALRSVLAEEEADPATDPAATAEDESAEGNPSEEQAANDDDRIRIDEDLRDKIEVFLSPALRATGRTNYYITARIENVSKEALQAPIRLAILGTEVEGLEVRDAHGSLSEGQPYFELIEDGKQLAAGTKSKTLKILFDSGEKRLTPAAIREFELTCRITREGLSYAEGRSEEVRDQVANNDDKEKDDRPLDANHPDVQKVMEAQKEWSDKLRQTEGVFGTGVGLDRNGNLVMKVFITRLSVGDKLPKHINGIPVDPHVMAQPRVQYELLHNRGQAGRFVPEPPTPPLPPCSDALVHCNLTTSTQIRIGRPVPLGSEIQNIFDFPCFVGTLGCRLTRDGKCFFLSNNHVIGGSNLAFVGEDLVQPGCYGAPLDTIGHVEELYPIFYNITITIPGFGTFVFRFVNLMDAAIASSHPFLVDRGTPCYGYGTPKSTTVQPALGMRVQKFGRTTELTHGDIIVIGASLDVGGYPGGQVANFQNQIIISGFAYNNIFSFPGDSGSLVVTHGSNVPVGLLFAGGGGITVANDINDVMAFFGTRIDGDCP